MQVYSHTARDHGKVVYLFLMRLIQRMQEQQQAIEKPLLLVLLYIPVGWVYRCSFSSPRLYII